MITSFHLTISPHHGKNKLTAEEVRGTYLALKHSRKYFLSCDIYLRCFSLLPSRVDFTGQLRIFLLFFQRHSSPLKNIKTQHGPISLISTIVVHPLLLQPLIRISIRCHCLGTHVCLHSSPLSDKGEKDKREDDIWHYKPSLYLYCCHNKALAVHIYQRS